ncbi:MAG: phosphotransferase, partial [Chloroflexota bacterium]|nr:phosphotransferase [Chloroflexota bacterium]
MREHGAPENRVECGVDGRVSTPVEDASIIRSLLAPDAVLAAVRSGYAVGSLDECTLIRALINDVYLLAGPSEQYVFKVYRPEWRNISTLLWEMDLLAHLSRQGAPVAPAIARRDGCAITAFAAPEG